MEEWNQQTADSRSIETTRRIALDACPLLAKATGKTEASDE